MLQYLLTCLPGSLYILYHAKVPSRLSFIYGISPHLSVSRVIPHTLNVVQVIRLPLVPLDLLGLLLFGGLCLGVLCYFHLLGLLVLPLLGVLPPLLGLLVLLL
jgi:hypothetical protein